MLCFSAEDMINTDMSTAFEQAILDYVNDPDPAYLQKLLGGMQQTQNGIHTSSLAKLKLTCAKL
jgi:hypothetical protein